jgi:hypothetical protein
MPYDNDKIKELSEKLLNEKGIKPAEAARLSGLHRATVYSIINGDKVGKDALTAFGNIQGDPSPFLVAAGYEQPSDVVERVAMALRCDKILSEEGKQQVLEFVKEMRDKYGEPGGGAQKD